MITDENTIDESSDSIDITDTISTNADDLEGTSDVESAAQPAEQTKIPIEDYLKIEPIEIYLGQDLVQLVRDGDLFDRITRLRAEVAVEVGFILPRVRIRDSRTLGKTEYEIRIDEQTVAKSHLFPDHYTIVEPNGVLATHLLEVVRLHAGEILTVDMTQHLLDTLYETSPVVVNELVPNVLTVAQVCQVLQLLLREQIPIRRLETILGALLEHGTQTKDPILLTTFVRQRLARTICIKPFANTGFAFTAISQYCCAHKFGNRIVMYPPHPDAPGSNKATFTEVPFDGELDVHPDTQNALSAMARMAWAVGTGEIITVEELPIGDDERGKYIITIKKERMFR